MSEESDIEIEESNIEIEQSNIDVPFQVPPNEIIHPEPDILPPDSTINPIDEDGQFIYDDDTNRLICVGTNFNDIPQSIIDTYSLKTKVRKER
jgi:hypothetical protein